MHAKFHHRQISLSVIWTRRLAVLAVLLGQPILADWPAYRHDAARSGYTSESLPFPLFLKWSFHLPNEPQPAWPRSSRMTYDRANHPIAAAGLVCFGSSADCSIRALNAEDGIERWMFCTDAPVRFTPLFWDGRLFAASDDGYLYCLDAATGKLLWKKQGGSNDELILGNNRMISRWPARGGPVLQDNIVYFAAGIWPSDGIYLHALDARSGRTLWVNDTAGYIFMGQPHGGAYAHSGISPQGHLALSEAQLFVPNGRAVPAAFRRLDGEFDYFHLQSNGQRGGSRIMLSDQFFINDGMLFEQNTGNALGQTVRGPAAAIPGGLLAADSKELIVYRWTDLERINRKGEKEAFRGLEEIVRIENRAAGQVAEVIVAGHHAFLGAAGEVCAVDLQTTNRVWKADVQGTACGLAVSGGKLLVSTDRGLLYCYDEKAGPPQEIRSPEHPEPYGENPKAKRAAQEILSQTGITEGYCLDLGSGDGALAYELAKRTRLHIVALEPDPEAVSLARNKLTQAGLYGSRVTVLQRDLARTGLPVYFANLIVSGRSVSEGESVVPRHAVSLLQRPYGGVLCLGRPGAMHLHKRGPLEGAGSWTHQYANPANTLCSNDQLVRGPLGMLWFADIGQRMVQRHGRAPAPLFNNGTLYSIGIDSLAAVDAYNGHLFWEYPLPGILAAYQGDHLMGTSGTGSNVCLSEDSLYVRRDDHCLRLDAHSGKLLSTFACPKTADGSPPIWGFIACDKGILFGSLANTQHVVTYRYLKGGDLTKQLTESKTLFALDAASGEFKWRYDAAYSLRHNAIAVGAGRVVLIDRPLALSDQTRDAKPTHQPTGKLVALRASTGEMLWQNNQDIYGTVAAISASHQSVLMSYQPTRFRLESELGGRLACFNLADGTRLWERNTQYHSRPIINEPTIYAEGGAWDLRTGDDQPFPFARSYGCGILASAKNLLVFRSATLGYLDLGLGYGTEEFGGMRPGCWINALPAGGLVFVPDASAGCLCSYQNQAWIALRPDGIRPPLIHPSGGVSRNPITVRLQADRPETEHLRYTLDGSNPLADSTRYDQPLSLTRTTLLRARAFGPDNRASRVVTAHFIIDPNAP